MASETAPLEIAVVGFSTHNRMFDEIGADLKKAGHRVVRYVDREAFKAVPEPLLRSDLLLCVGNCPVSRSVLMAAPRLRAVVTAVTGYDGIDVQAATDRGVVIANAQTPENVTGMAEATVLLVLAALYDFNGTQDLIRKFLPRPDPLRAHQLRGKTVGFVGLGKIGREAARLLAPFGAKMQYTARRDADLTGLPPMPRVGLDDLMRDSDIVVVLASLNGESRHLLNARNLRLMKRTAILVNVSRGAVVDENALIALLRDRAIVGAALDVFEAEPLAKESPLRDLPNVILTPHMIGHTYEAHRSLEMTARESLERAMAGRPPRYVVNPDVLPAWTARWSGAAK